MLPSGLLNSALWARMQLVRWTHWRQFVRATRSPAVAQAKVLRNVLHRNRTTCFGKEHGFASIRTYAEYADAVAPQTYDALRPYIDTQERTGTPALNRDQPVMYAQTSGTTAKAKLIPVLPASLRQHRRSQAVQSYAQFAAEPRAYAGRFLAIVSPAEEGRLETGTPFGSMSGFMYANMPAAARTKYVVPHQVFGIPDYDLKYLVILRIALACPDVTHIACANPSTLVKLLAMLDAHRGGLLSDILDGGFSRVGELSDETRRAVVARLSCPPARASALETILGAPRPTFAALWPRLRLVSTWTGGSCRIPLAAVRAALPPETRVTELGYLSSELRGTIVADLDQLGGVPTVHENFFEFVERDAWEAGRPTFYVLDQIESGREYYVFPTTSTGLYRYVMNDIVRVTGRFHETPTFEFVQKGKGVTNITGEKLSESQVIDAVTSMGDESGFTPAFFLMLADVDTGRYRLVVEADAAEPARAAFASVAIEQKLRGRNVEYAAKQASGRLQPLQILWVKPGTGEAYKRSCVQRGQREGQFKLIALQYAGDCDFPFDAHAADLTAQVRS